ncbi:MAG: Maf family protein [Eubacteriales bacterium]|nr:Maf family protein [Eubacteriales bacterium]MDD3882778.1 Maf family protein [Eubacteriales bacterium]MDD4512952.1 Maf family protein [Eubacteriales bacterium]
MLYLASSSPRRKELLSSAGIEFSVAPSFAEEIKDGNPSEIASENARRKALGASVNASDGFILGADTVVFANGECLGKPQDASDARRMLSLLSGREHSVFTGVCLRDVENTFIDVRVDECRVWFSEMSEKEIDDYIACGECMGKAGAYAIQGRAGKFIPRISGSFSCVVGLPLELVSRMLREHNAV